MAIRRALISVSDKTGIVEFAAELAKLGVQIISTGGTTKLAKEKGVPVIGISEVTGFPEILDGRVKTLHPAVHSGLLAVRDDAEHQKAMKKLGLDYIDLVVVNLYPFAATIAKPNVSYEDAIENIDIGGPTMLRSAAKNHAFVTVVVDAADYANVLEEVRAGGDTTLETRKRLAAKVFRHTGAYDALLAITCPSKWASRFQRDTRLLMKKCKIFVMARTRIRKQLSIASRLLQQAILQQLSSFMAKSFPTTTSMMQTRRLQLSKNSTSRLSLPLSI